MQTCPLDALTLFIDTISTASPPSSSDALEGGLVNVHPSVPEQTTLEDQIYAQLLQGPRIDILAQLPYETATYILQFVDLPCLIKVATISRTWYHLANDNKVWKGIFHQRWKIKIPPLIPLKTTSLPPLLSYRVLDWRKLCHDRKALQNRWGSLPTKTKLKGHDDSVYCVQFDDVKIVTGSRDRTIKIWDARTLECIRTLRGHSLSVLCLQYNDKLMVSGSSDNTIIVWDMQTYEVLGRLYGHTFGVLDVCFDDKYIISCSKDTTIRVWDLQKLALIGVIRGHRSPVNAVQMHKGQVVSASGDGFVKLWDIATRECIRVFEGHQRGLACVQFDGETIVSGSNDKTIRIWDAATGECRRILEGHTNLVRALHVEKNKIVSGSYDCSVRVWDMTTGECTLNLNSGHASWVFDVQFSCSRIIR